MKVIVVEPKKKPYVKNVSSELKSLQSEVGGYIQVIYPFDEPVGLICNEEGKLDGLPLNRSLHDEAGEIYDIIAGTFLIVGLTEDNFGDLDEELIPKFIERFEHPEEFIRMGRKIISILINIE